MNSGETVDPAPQKSREDIDELRAKLRETEDLLVAMEELLIATGHSWEDVERDGQSGDSGHFSVRSAAGPYRLLVEQMPQPALTVMPDGAVAYCNEALAQLVGKPRERLVGSLLGDILVGAANQASISEQLTLGSHRERSWVLLTMQGAITVRISSRSTKLFGRTVHSLVIYAPHHSPADQIARPAGIPANTSISQSEATPQQARENNPDASNGNGSA